LKEKRPRAKKKKKKEKKKKADEPHEKVSVSKNRLVLHEETNGKDLLRGQ